VEIKGKIGVKMIVYRCKKRFFCSALQRHIPVGAEVLKHENEEKIQLRNAPFTDQSTGITKSVSDFEGKDQISWFYALEGTAFFEIVKNYNGSEQGAKPANLGVVGMHLDCFTVSERNQLGIVKKGRVIFNTTRGSIEVFDGSVWLNDDLIKLKNKSGMDLREGAPIAFSKDFTGAVTTTDTAKDVNVLGVVVDSARDGGFLTVATSGTYRVNIKGSIKKGDFIVSSSTAGKAKSSGAKRIAAVFGVALQDGTDTLIKAIIFQG
jgi:hypothetical protein